MWSVVHGIGMLQGCMVADTLLLKDCGHAYESWATLHLCAYMKISKTSAFLSFPKFMCVWYLAMNIIVPLRQFFMN